MSLTGRWNSPGPIGICARSSAGGASGSSRICCWCSGFGNAPSRWPSRSTSAPSRWGCFGGRSRPMPSCPVGGAGCSGTATSRSRWHSARLAGSPGVRQLLARLWEGRSLVWVLAAGPAESLGGLLTELRGGGGGTATDPDYGNGGPRP